MKYRKLLSKVFTERSNNNAQVAIAIVAGLAAGAVLSILLAPEKGSDLRGRISGGARGLGDGLRDKYASLKDRLIGNQPIEEPVAAEVPHFKHTTVKKRKSDIKDLIEEAHHPTTHDETQD